MLLLQKFSSWRHAELDPASSFLWSISTLIIWIPVFAGMTQVERTARYSASFAKISQEKDYTDFLTNDSIY